MSGMTEGPCGRPGGSTLYESGIFATMADGVMRPGGLRLTKQLVEACAFPPGVKVIDIGCGAGMTVELLRDQYGLDAVGIDSSAVLLRRGKERSPDLRLVQATGDDLPLTDGSVNGVFAECSLSVMRYADGVLSEINRVLVPRGKLVISDIYLREPEGAMALRNLPCTGCISGALTNTELVQKLQNSGFTLLGLEDRSDFLKEFIVRLIMDHGSLDEFWQATSTGEEDIQVLQSVVKKARPGYFWLMAEKDSTFHKQNY